MLGMGAIVAQKGAERKTELARRRSPGRFDTMPAMCYTHLWKPGPTSTPGRIETVSKIIHKVEHILGAGGVPFSGARVDVIGQKDGQQRTVTYRTVDKMKRLTGIPAAVGAWMLARGQVKAKGVFAPEGCLEPEPFFAELAQRDSRIEEFVS